MESNQDGEKILVCVRKRPPTMREIEQDYEQIIDINKKKGEIAIRNPSEDEINAKVFKFDKIFESRIGQKQVYQEAVSNLTDQFLEGYNCAVLCYGQTGAGKTYTIRGVKEVQDHKGIMERAFEDIFAKIQLIKNANQDGRSELKVKAYCYDLHHERFQDLVKPYSHTNDFQIKESKDVGVYLKGICYYEVRTASEAKEVMYKGIENQCISITQMSYSTSRFTTFFALRLENILYNLEEGRIDSVTLSNFIMVDMCGSERSTRTTANNYRQTQTQYLGISSLHNVISSLTDKKSKYVPYRDSKLTRHLQEYFGGTAKITMIFNMGPTDYNYDETLSTLRCAIRASQVMNKQSVKKILNEELYLKYIELIAETQLYVSEVPQVQKKTSTPQHLNIPKQQSNQVNETFEEELKSSDKSVQPMIKPSSVLKDDESKINDEVKQVNISKNEWFKEIDKLTDFQEDLNNDHL